MQIRPLYEGNNFSEQIDTVSKKISLKSLKRQGISQMQIRPVYEETNF